MRQSKGAMQRETKAAALKYTETDMQKQAMQTRRETLKEIKEKYSLIRKPMQTSWLFKPFFRHSNHTSGKTKTASKPAKSRISAMKRLYQKIGVTRLELATS